MPRIKINEWWENLKREDPEQYKARREIARKKAANTRLLKKIQESNFRRRIDKPAEWDWHMRVARRLQRLSSDDISKMSNSRLLYNIEQANKAISIRESDLITNIAAQEDIPSGQVQYDFRRESFEPSENASHGELSHILRMQQKYLQRQNTYEDVAIQAYNMGRRIMTKANFNQATFAKINEESKLFWKAYRKALELYNAGGKESKGSPIYAAVVDIMRAGKYTDVDTILEQVTEEKIQVQRDKIYGPSDDEDTDIAATFYNFRKDTIPT